MKYLIGIDSGGTKYLVKACDLDGRQIAEYVGAPAGHYRFSKEEAVRRMNDNINACIAKFGGKREDCAYLVCGTTGVDSDEDQREINEIYNSLDGFICPVVCVNDVEIAHFASTGGIGAVVVAGTGSIAFGRNTKGETTRSGGWPLCIFGDDGSGTWISLKALQYMSFVFDNRVSKGVLWELLNEKLNLKSRKELIQVCIQIEKMQWQSTDLSILVDRAAGQGDKYATEILQEAAQCTYGLAASIIEKLKLYEEPEFKVGAWGSAIIKSPLHFQLFKQKLEQNYPDVQVRIADIDAGMGACRMAQALMLHK